MPCALVIGASRGIGREWVRQYLGDGWRVIATCRSEAHRVELTQAGAQAIRMDLVDANQVAGLAWQLDGEHIDVVVISAGHFGPRKLMPFAAPTMDDFDQVMRTNVLGAMRIIPIVAPLLQASRGTLAIMSSRMGSMSDAPGTWGMLYRASKAALNMTARIAQAEFGRQGVRVLTFNTGWVRTDMGGSGADVDVQSCVGGMREVIADPERWPGGIFVNHLGTEVSW